MDRAAVARQRIDRWLWHARVVRTRSAAAGLVHAGYVRVNGTRIEAAGAMVRVGDVITIALGRGVRVLKILAFAERRGPSQEAQKLYAELGPGSSASVAGCSLADPAPMR